jgi:hypothetical protein
MTTSKPGYGAIPPANIGPISAQGLNGQILTSNGMNGTSWASQGITNAQTKAIQIGSPDPVVTFALDGNITTRAGTITAEDWVTTIKVMKRLIMDMSQDQELVSKYPYIRDAAYTWLMEELKK